MWEYEAWRPFAHVTGTASQSKTLEGREPDRARSAPTEQPAASTTEAYRQAIETLPPGDLVRLCVTLYTRVEQLETALQSRIIIEQAKGVLAERMQLEPEDAFDLLRLAARSERRKLRELAKQVIEENATPQAIIRAMAREQRWRAAALRERNEALEQDHSKIEAAQKRQGDRLALKPQGKPT